ncbi:MAG: phosphate ABC transporter permease subunit PstC [Paludibacterium sp.]|uniref:phosphate ABC transporter permease subunit PstC n=1 Tax=Paludibacterium sp. TaxID=1917523 RepID=UPI0025D62697|nr:phosphate ABC transporter permease subunit PstC [Paludibacterium sp.]MBV8048625.1 phosphate ABC transporter permease subunit PstC [Paludibacterium sp.]MBV8649119.1 phosphate ABC transporter permease subunit PstC [Paludibacterium sp.]
MEKFSNDQVMRRQMLLDQVFKVVTRGFAFLVLALLVGILISLLIGAMPSIKAFGLGFLASSEWDPVANNFGAAVPIFGTLITSLIALLIGVPVSFGIALFLTELCPTWLKRPLGIAVELLAGIPSIIYGMWGLFVFAPYFSDHIQPWLIDNIGPLPLVGWIFQGAPMGIGIFTAGLILAIMVIPFIASVMRDVFEVVPTLLKESAYGLGSTTWEVVRYVVLPYTKTGVVGGIMLGLGRALGETMAVTFVIGNSSHFAPGLFQPGNSIASSLANEFAEANGDLYIASLIQLGLILFFITFVVLACSKILLLRLKRQEGKES